MYRKISLVFLAVLFIITAGCSSLIQTKESDSANSGSGKKSESEDTDHLEESNRYANLNIPDELDDLELQKGAGTFGGKKYDLRKIHPELDKIPENISPRQLDQRLRRLMAEDFRPYVHLFETYDTSVLNVGNSPASRPKIKLPKGQEVNVVILLDASGSMADQVSGETKMDLAKKSVQNFISNMPDGAHVSLQVYGHKGSNSKKDKDISCESVEEVYPLGSYKKNAFNKAMDSVQPAGWTPLASSIRQAQDTLKTHVGDGVQNIVYVVSDGIETCDGDPVKEAEKLHGSEIEAVVNIIGLDVDDEGQKALKKAADAGGGEYHSVDSKVDLQEYFQEEYDRLYDEWSNWADIHYKKAEIIARKKYDDLEARGGKMRSTAEMEYYHLKDAADYLEKKRKFDYSIISDLRSMWMERRDTLKEYASNRRDDLQSEVRERRDRVQDIIRNKRDSAQDRLTD
ncbi:VWA domain-containing protein [Kroppenstedtia pulmonis]|uniref:VWA domain-containing protein n=1 Tax=Kroppenstedtia pulmonis TaxID=1380685 RepID=A0A7D3Y1T2_9BACL|nr:VWA domain-containing protein [Kroppenstedtia pulmonis]QKG84403.1 VWA domain-containing protein [Kroppenstedtia pulmonis]